MKECKELEDFIRGRLEGEFAGEPPRLDAIMRAASEAAASRAAASRSRRIVWGALLAAASLAVLLSASVAALQTGTASSADTIAEVIDLLQSDGETVSNSTSVVERFLAWQDAPYEQAISGLQAADQTAMP